MKQKTVMAMITQQHRTNHHDVPASVIILIIEP